ncbi:hypothetical protein [Paludibaculum fermentans]|uniref:Lipoprotein n=1 Tax=Paludibaculum fermentans TaxID=1473598 RepID=A0A7S7NPJ7_PALFE|nr:hypothetical protein [Paludibaculum fermentans]QOY87422.1 hypothetical protein IRI77_32460 [Paludibaculum fermentans]
MKPALLVSLIFAVALGTSACFLFRKARNWADLKQTTVDLDGLATVKVPSDLRYDAEPVQRSGDTAQFQFRRVNDTHLNGQTSYAETMVITIAAPDLDRATFEAQRRQGLFDVTKASGTGATSTEGPLQWEIFQTVYERDPVKEPAHYLRLTDAEAGIVITWLGYQKQYTVEQARANLKYLRSTITVAPTRAAYFEKLRDYKTNSRTAEAARNLELLSAALKELGFPPATVGQWTRHGTWRYTIDNGRPQQFQLVLPVNHMRMPDGAFELKGPLTSFKFIQNKYWWQNNQGRGGGLIPQDLLPGLVEEMTDREDVYFFSIHGLNLWKSYPGDGNPLLTELRSAIVEAEKLKAEFFSKGLIGGDAEP